MGLKNKHSLFDLVKGNDPVGNMETEPIKPFQPSTTEASNKHIESLQKVPGPPQNSPHQDLDGQQGPQFQRPLDVAINMLLDLFIIAQFFFIKNNPF